MLTVFPAFPLHPAGRRRALLVALGVATFLFVACTSVELAVPERPAAALAADPSPPVTAAAPAAAAAPSAPVAAALPVEAPHATGTEAVRIDALGVDIVGVRLSAEDYVVDLRYRVFDAAKAAPLQDRGVRPVLVRQDGERFYIPTKPLVGTLRQTRRNNAPIDTSRTYFMLFANPDRKLQQGDVVALYLGDARAESLVVQR